MIEAIPFGVVILLIITGKLEVKRTVPYRDLSDVRLKMRALADHPEHIYEMGRENCVLCDPPPVPRDFYAEAMAELDELDPPEWLWR